MKGLLACGLAATLLAGQASNRSQPLAGQGVFRSSTALVEVDVIVKDKDGGFVSGLTADDFELLEDNRPQRIEHFYLVSENAQAADHVSAVRLPRSPDQTDRRVFVLFFDSEHLSVPALQRAKEAATRFIGDRLRPGDLAGVFAEGVLWRGHLTTDREEVLDGIRAVAPVPGTAATRRAQLLEFPRISSELDALRIEAGDQRLLDGVADENCARERVLCAEEGGREYVIVKLQRKAISYVTESRRAANATLRMLSYVSRNVAALRGRKTLLMITEGFYAQDSWAELPLVAGQAARAGVTIYSIDARGTAGAGTRTVPDATVSIGSLSLDGDSAESGLDVLAAETGGRSFRHMDDLTAVMASVAEDTSTYYVLAYSPDNPVLDGRFRKIALKTSWKGLTIRARRGYVATPLPPPKGTHGK
jgi:VWFA-related protein